MSIIQPLIQKTPNNLNWIKCSKNYIISGAYDNQISKQSTFDKYNSMQNLVSTEKTVKNTK